MILYVAKGQIGPLEFMAGDRYLHYQHSVSRSFKPESTVGWQHIATLVKRYNTRIEKGGMQDELMNQAYLTLQIHQLLVIKGGLFYTHIGGYQPSVGLQFSSRNKHLSTMLSPRVDLTANGSYEMFAMFEYFPSLSQNKKLYTRLQAMSNFSADHHNRSYQQLRVGVSINTFQVGAGITFDQYGTSGTIYCNSGVFVRRVF